MQSGNVDGLSFTAHGREHKILPGLDQANARKALVGLKALGVDVMPDGVNVSTGLLRPYQVSKRFRGAVFVELGAP
jgi:hypothetical protein